LVIFLKAQKALNIQLDLIKIKNFCSIKETNKGSL
jgi:hypothetical protein